MSFDVTGDLVNAGTIVGSEIVKASVFLDLNQAATGQSVTIDDVAFPLGVYCRATYSDSARRCT